MSIEQFTIYGERCSGTNYLENILLMNFDIQLTWQYGRKHFFGFSDLANSDNTLFCSIVRNPLDWYNSFLKAAHHLKPAFKDNIAIFLYEKLISYDNDIEIKEDRNMYNNQHWNNVVDLRNNKLKYLIETLPINVKNSILIKYEDLLDNFDLTLYNIKEKYNLKIKSNIDFPQNSITYFGPGNHLGIYKKKTYSRITNTIIQSHPNYTDLYETILDYTLL